MGFFSKLANKWKSNQAGNKAEYDEWHDRLPEAAELRAQQAALDLTYNELIAADENRYAFKDWLRAGNPAKALEQARTSLNDYSGRDWLKSQPGHENDYLKELAGMVSDLQTAGFDTEAAALLDDINKVLKLLGEKPVQLVVLGTPHKFPDTCPNCGASLHYAGSSEQITCPYCNGTVHSIS